MRERLIIAIDCDDVLLDFNSGLATYSNEHFGTSYCLEDVVDFDLSIHWGIPGDQVIERIFAFYNSMVCAELLPIEGSEEAIKKLKEKYDLRVVTNRPKDVLPITINSVERHFPNMFDGIYCTNAFAKIYGDQRSVAASKVTVCQDLGAGILIDDSRSNLVGCAEVGIQGILFRRPWNRYLTDEMLLTEGIKPANSWEEITQKIG